MRDAVAPSQKRSARTLAALQRLDGKADPAVIEEQAALVFAAMLDLIVAQRARGFEIGRDVDGLYARPRSSTVGPARELIELAAKCRKAIAGKISDEQWTTIWAAQPERIGRLWEPRLIETKQDSRCDGAWIRRAGIRRDIDQSTLALGFAVEGFAMIAPKPAVVLPAIEAALIQITATPRSKTRTRNEDEARALTVIKTAYRAITGKKAGRVLYRGRLVGRFAALGREIDAIFGTALFAVKDSVRLR